jgi:hypothetical protein
MNENKRGFTVEEYDRLGQEFIDSLNDTQKRQLFEMLAHDNAMERIAGYTPCFNHLFRTLKDEGVEPLHQHW